MLRTVVVAVARPARRFVRHLDTPPKQTAPTHAPKLGSINSTSLMPDVHSTGLGLEDPLTNDPLKWKKFAFKYAGAVLLFMVSYKTLHWYVDRLEADGKRRKEEMEQNKTIVQHIKSTDTSPGKQQPQVQPQIQTQPQQNEAVFRPFDVVKDEQPGQVSQLDELFVYLAELEAKQAVLQQEKSSKQVNEQLAEIKLDIDAVRVEIKEMQAKLN